MPFRINGIGLWHVGRFKHSAPVLRELAEVSLYFGDTEAAQDFGEQALEVEPNDDTHVLLGRVVLAAL